MRVVYLLNSEQVGGGNRSLLDLWPGLQAMGIEVTSVSPRPGPMVRICHDMSVPCEVATFREPDYRRPLRSISAYREWKGILDRAGGQLVHSNGLQASRSIAVAAWRRNLRHVCHVHCSSPTEYCRWVFRRLPQPDLFVYVSEATRESMEPRLRQSCPRSQHRVIYNGIAPETFEVPVPDEEARPRIGIVANLLPVKGHPEFLKMARILTEAGSDAEFWLIGGDIYAEGHDVELKRLCQDLGLEDRTTFFGARNDVPELLAQLDILVCSSHEEQFPKAILEGMASSKPIVATRVGGIAEMVVDGETGLLVPPYDAASLAKAVATLLESKSVRQQMGNAGRKRVADHFSLSRQVDSTYEVYEKLV